MSPEYVVKRRDGTYLSMTIGAPVRGSRVFAALWIFSQQCAVRMTRSAAILLCDSEDTSTGARPIRLRVRGQVAP